MCRGRGTWQLCVCVLSHGQFFVTPRTRTHQVPLSMGLSQKEYWSGCHFLFLNFSVNLKLL